VKNFVLALTLCSSFISIQTVTADEIANRCRGSQNPLFDSVPLSFDSMEGTTDQVNAIMAEDRSDGNGSTEQETRFELFRFEKDYHQKNVLHYGIKVNTPSCTISYKSNGAPNFSTYWRMGEERNQIKNMTNDDLKKVGPIVLSHNEHTVRFKMNALKEINIRKKEITIEAEIVDGTCRVKGYIELDDGRKVNLNRIFANISSFIGIPTGVSALTVDGNDRATGERVSVRFRQ